MNAVEWLTNLERLGVTLTLVNDNLVIDAPVGLLGDDQIAELRAHKPAIVLLLKQQQPHGQGVNHCFPHGPFDKELTPDGERWTCRRCGRFYGYAPGQQKHDNRTT